MGTRGELTAPRSGFPANSVTAMCRWITESVCSVHANFREFFFPRTPVNRPPGNASGPPGGIIDVAIAWEMNASWQEEEGGGSYRVL
jgi:hypothetical protein